MYCGKDFDPADPDESDVFSFDFVNDLASGETVISTTWAITVLAGFDPTPALRFVGLPGVNASLTTGLNTVSSQRLGGLLNAVTYAVKADVVTTNSNTKSLWSRIPSANMPMVA
jgi:hypothetical protein